MNMQQPPRAEAVGYEQGMPATSPFTGGAEQYKVNQAYQSYLDNQREAEQKSRLNEARISNLNEPSSRRDNVARYPVQLPDGSTIEVTGNEALAHYNRVNKPAKTDDEWRLNRALARGRLDEKGNFTNDYAEAASGEMVQVRKPDGTVIVVPWAEYQRRTNPAARSADPELTARSSDHESVLQEARDAIKKGKDPEAVRKRLAEMGIDATGL
jgi:hypothetical protein